ncbi:hypothetical protein VUR80DRAFT_2732 [Thermomyces stellatus]
MVSSDDPDASPPPPNTAPAGEPVDPPASQSDQTPSPSPRRHSMPLAFPPLFQRNASASLIHSTAEGRPIPVDDSTAADRTSALRELNSHFPSRHHRYTKSTGAQSTTYSQPVIVRTYPGPRLDPTSPRSQPGTSRPASTNPSVIHRIIPFVSDRSHHSMLSLARSKKSDEARLPPVESFTFKSIMNDSHGNITADLERIAEICARSRYSLSNQYEVHQAPHGSGESFLASVSGAGGIKSGPTLQAVSSSDDERTLRRRRRRRSVAVGTLETIMSSSRSSDEDPSKKKSAAEIADEVRGRAAARKSGDSSPVSASTGEPVLKRRMSFLPNVVVEGEVADSAGLVSEPAQPKTCTDFEVRGEESEEKEVGLLASLSRLIWGGGASHAEGSLRELLRSEGKGKGVER